MQVTFNNAVKYHDYIRNTIYRITEKLKIKFSTVLKCNIMENLLK